MATELSTTLGTELSTTELKELHRRTWAQTRADWFGDGEMAFFDTILETGAYVSPKGGAYFVTSEKPPHDRRRYSVRRMDIYTGAVGTVGEFCGHKTLKTAIAARNAAVLAGTETP